MAAQATPLKGDDAKDPTKSGAARSRPPPIFVQLYEKLAPLSTQAHADLRLVRGSFAFARNTTTVHLCGGEFMAACHDFPILFLMADNPIPVALLGLRKSENLFVDGRGQWRIGAYIPAYLRRYPFLFPETGEPKQLAVLIDEASALLSKEKGAALYDKGEKSKVLQQAIDLGRDFHVDQSRTRPALRAIKDHDLLVKQDIRVPIANGRSLTLRDFWVIDQKKFTALSGDAYLDLRGVGAIDLAYFHFASMNRLMSHARLIDARAKPPQPPLTTPKGPAKRASTLN